MGKRRLTFLRGEGGGGAVFTKKKKLKSEIFNDKQSLQAKILTYIEVTKEIS